MNQSLKEITKEHFEQYKLTPNQQAQLEQLLCEETLKVPPSKKLFWQSLSTIAAVLLVFCGMLIYPQYVQKQQLKSIAQEVAINHLKMKPLDIESQTLSTIRSKLNKLDFMPLASNHFNFENQGLIGARYCSIQSITAAQLRFKSPSSNYQTLYQVPYDSEKFGEIPSIDKKETPLQRYEKGLMIEIWQEKGLLMVSTRVAKSH